MIAHPNQLKGNVINFNSFPLRMDFSTASYESIEYLQELQYSNKEENLNFICSMTSSGKQVKTNTLQITANQLNELSLKEKLFGPSHTPDSSAVVYITRDQLMSLAMDTYSALNIDEECEMPESQFSEAFVEGLVSQIAASQFTHVDIDKALTAKATCGIDFKGDLRADEIKRDLSEVLQVNTINGKKQIVVNEAKSQQFIDNFSFSTGLSGLPAPTWLIGSSLNFAVGNDYKNLQDTKSLNDQLTELNRKSDNNIKWEIEGTRVVPKSINVVRISRARMTKTLKFTRVQRKQFSNSFKKEFSLYSQPARFADFSKIMLVETRSHTKVLCSNQFTQENVHFCILISTPLATGSDNGVLKTLNLVGRCGVVCSPLAVGSEMGSNPSIACFYIINHQPSVR